jgi:hypothetical protein
VETSNMGLGYAPGSFRKQQLSVSQNADPQARSTHSSFRQPHFNSQSASRVSIKEQEEEYEESTARRDAKQGCGDAEAVSSNASSEGVQMKSLRRGRRLKSAGAIRGGAWVGGRCQWAVRAVRVELRRRAWGVLSGQARLQVGGPLRSCSAVGFFRCIRSFLRGRFHSSLLHPLFFERAFSPFEFTVHISDRSY